MRKRKYLVGALLGVIGTVVVASIASAAVTGQTYSVTTSPTKVGKKTFTAVKKFTNVVDTAYSGGFQPNATQTVLTFSKDIKFTPGNLPQCNLTAIATVPQATADAQCAGAKVGTGGAQIQPGNLRGVVAAYNGTKQGGSPTIGLHTDIFLPSGNYSGLSTTLVGVLNTKSNTLTVSIPPTGTSITHFDTTITKRKTGKSSFYIMARCRKGKWLNSETTTFTNGQTTSASTKQKCKGV
jgi:hypothetical protein